MASSGRRTRSPFAPGRVALERALSKLGLASRTEARALIREGRVRVNGQVATSPLQPVTPERAKIVIDQVSVVAAQPFTLMLHKPKGVVTTRSDERGRATVYSLLEDVKTHVIPVGRLDFATSGLLLLSNDTRFAAWVTDPLNRVPKVYLASVRGEFTAEKAARLVTEGVLDDGDRLRAEQIEVRKTSARESHLTVTLTEGKNREIRRMLKALGHEVTRLKRVTFGGLDLDGLALGKWREVTPQELLKAFPGAQLLALAKTQNNS